MRATADFLAVDLGASGGRVMLGRWDGARFTLEELHRFANGPVPLLGRLHWDHLRLWDEILTGLRRYGARFGRAPDGIGVDTWGVDYALLDRTGRLLGQPYHYRDHATDGVPALVFARVPRAEIYRITGIQFMQLNTLYQLYARVLAADPHLEWAETLLMTPDLFHYWLTGRKVSEYTIASTSQMLAVHTRTWATDLLHRLDIPTHFLPPLILPGTIWETLSDTVRQDLGWPTAPPVIATGSHDTANAVAAVPELDDGSVYISSGTWSLMGIERLEPIVTEAALAFDGTNEGGVCLHPGGPPTIRFLKNVAGLWLLQESRNQWQREGRTYGWDELLAAAAEAPPFRSLIDPDAPDFIHPGDMPAVIRRYCRRHGQPEPESVGQLVRCVLESLALKYRRVLEALETVGGRRLETIRIVGGGSQNRLLNQFTADACRRPVVAGPVEATALGNVMMQAIATGHLSDGIAGRQALAASFPRQVFEPGPDAGWDEAYARFLRLLDVQD
jgi:rhamnulokinase